MLIADALVAVEEEVVGDGDDGDVAGQAAEVVEVFLPGLWGIAAVFLVDRCWRVDVEIPAAPLAAAEVMR